MVSLNEEQTFKDLIKSTGHEQAPDSIMLSVMQGIQVQENATVQDYSIISKRTLIVIITAFIAMLIYGIMNSSGFQIDILSKGIQMVSLPKFEITILQDLNIFQNMSRLIILVVPAVIIQFFLMKKYTEGKLI